VAIAIDAKCRKRRSPFAKTKNEKDRPCERRTLKKKKHRNKEGRFTVTIFDPSHGKLHFSQRKPIEVRLNKRTTSRTGLLDLNSLVSLGEREKRPGKGKRKFSDLSNNGVGVGVTRRSVQRYSLFFAPKRGSIVPGTVT